MKVLGYVRVSTDKQSDEGVSLDAQRAKLAAYAQAMGLELVAIIEDTGSAKTLEREGWRELVARLDAGDAAGVLVAKLDRLTRSVKDLGTLLDSVFRERGGAALLSVADSIDTRTAGGRLVLNVLASVAQWEREIISERTREAMAHLRAQGVRLNAGDPLGLRMTSAVDAHGRRVWEVIPDEIETIRFIVHARERKQPLRVIAASLNMRGLRSKSGREWCPKKISRVLRYAPEVLAFSERSNAVQSSEVMQST